MHSFDCNTRVFLDLVRAGLWETEIRIKPYDNIDWKKVYQLSEEQSVVGLVAAGIEHVIDIKVPQDIVLMFVGATIQLDQRNKAMNKFLARMIDKLRIEDVYVILVKGQGVAQCYERPLWRTSGDVDLLVSDSNYRGAKSFFDEVTGTIKTTSKKNTERRHIEYYIGDWVVELHGTLHTNLSKGIDKVVDSVQDSVFYGGEVRSWSNNGTAVYLPSSNNDIIFVFTHILQHLFKGGVGIRQLCDLTRLLWKYKKEINIKLLGERLKRMGLMSEWKVFGYIMVNTLGLPEDSMPFYDSVYKSRAERLLDYSLACGNFGHNKDYSYFNNYSPLIRKMITLWRQTIDSLKLTRVFHLDSIKFLFRFIIDGVKAAVAGD